MWIANKVIICGRLPAIRAEATAGWFFFHKRSILLACSLTQPMSNRYPNVTGWVVGAISARSIQIPFPSRISWWLGEDESQPLGYIGDYLLIGAGTRCIFAGFQMRFRSIIICTNPSIISQFYASELRPVPLKIAATTTTHHGRCFA